jgi:hypothetical protein
MSTANERCVTFYGCTECNVAIRAHARAVAVGAASEVDQAFSSASEASSNDSSAASWGISHSHRWISAEM